MSLSINATNAVLYTWFIAIYFKVITFFQMVGATWQQELGQSGADPI